MKSLNDLRKKLSAEQRSLRKRWADCIKQEMKKKQLQALNGYIRAISETPMNVTRVLFHIKDFVERPEFIKFYKLLHKNKTRYDQRDLVKKYLHKQNELVKEAIKLLDYQHMANKTKIQELKRDIWYCQVNFTFKTVVTV